ncbi:S-adenosyl-L-methionine-dependent methyltransferase [Mycena galopus ATCC 62051]|nr:S-adenosyl-L-methionine-dependent methyltransferase [Mycena galopus ATCC 62051]
MVTNLDASIYVQLKVPSVTNPNQLETLSFDWILCDVPCGGDGTMRKNLGIWKTWQPMDGNGLHGLQLHILQHAMKMLAPQGRVVYSKCSLNPVENEADIACAPRNNPDLRLVDVSMKLPALHRRPGLTAWKPTDKSLCTKYDTYDTFMKTCTGGDMVKAKMSRGIGRPRTWRNSSCRDAGGYTLTCKTRGGSSSRCSNARKRRKRRSRRSRLRRGTETRGRRLCGDSRAQETKAGRGWCRPKVEDTSEASSSPSLLSLCPPFHSLTHFFLLHRHGHGSDRKQHLDPAHSAPAPASTSARNPVSGTWVQPPVIRAYRLLWRRRRRK